MKSSTLELLRCPGCRGGLSPHGGTGQGGVEDGDLACRNCDRSYPIRNGIVRFIRRQDLDGLDLRFARFYDRYSRFEAIASKLSFLAFGGERRARAEVLDRLELNGGRVLEVSIGSGGNLRYLFESPRVGEVYGLDLSAAQLERCRGVAEKRGWPVELFLGTGEALPFQDDAFDSVFHIGGINFFSGKRKAIDEMIRVARPGSRIVIADESERVARVGARLLRLSRYVKGGAVDTSVPVHLVPETMEEIRVVGIWKGHGHHHGYRLEFRKPR